MNEWEITPRPLVRKPVKPRKPRETNKPIIAISESEVLLENGELLQFSRLPFLIQTEPSSILVSHNFGGIIRYLDDEFGDNPLWQFRASPVERAAWAPNRKRKAVMRDCVIGYLGFKGPNKKKGHYHYPLSPQTFVLKTVSELRRNIPGEDANIIKLMEWAKEVRDFLLKHKLNLSPTSGGIAAQLLKDDKFYPEARRKVPRRTNAAARGHLPGNFYELYAAEEGKGYHKAAYLDQSNAHHTAAAELQFPDANTLQRRGRHATLEDRSFAKIGTAKYDSLISQHGLFYLAFEAPRFGKADFPHPALPVNGGYSRGYFYSNEIPFLEELKVRIRHIIACWTSPDTDPGLNRYSEWAQEEIEKSSVNSKPWLKPTLLSTYGVLASKPKILEFGYKRAEGGVDKRYPCGSGFLDVKAKASTKMREPLMANVIHRGMIEAQTRMTSLRLARELAKQGFVILAIYADSVFVETTELPLLPPPWRVQDFLTSLHFESATHFTSREISKLPGVPLSRGRGYAIPPRPSRAKAEAAKRGKIAP